MRACIAIIDSTRARICEYDERNAAGHELHEIFDMLNPGRRHIAEVFEDTESGERIGGGNSAGVGTHQQATDDHRQQFVNTRDEKFAREVVAQIDRIVREGAFPHLVLIASPHMLGEIRKHAAVLERDGLKLDEYDRDLGGMNDAQVHDHLAHAGIVAPRRRIAAAR
ncbi:MAG: host attachment protein [Deltaproteobacteria bacterium]|nr:host attachment protein [Deltaproteobacteria bacterium]